MDVMLYIRMIWRGAWIVLLTALSAVGIVLYSASVTIPLYRTSAQFIISPDPKLERGDIIYGIDTLDRRSLVTTYSEVLGSRRVFTEAAAALKMTPAMIKNYTHTSVVLPDAHVLELGVTGPDPHMVALLANEMGQRTIVYIEQLYNGTYDVAVLEQAETPLSPISPQPLRDAVLALALGVLFGAVLAIGREYLRDRFQAQEQASDRDATPVLRTRDEFQHGLSDAIAADRGKVFSLAFVQLDGLHEIIWTHPEVVEHHVLPQIKRILRDELPSTEWIGRWNETVFAIMLPELVGPAVMQSMNHLAHALSKPLELEGSDTIRLRPSVGTTSFLGTESTATLIAQAEEALGQSHATATQVVWFSDVAPVRFSRVAHDEV